MIFFVVEPPECDEGMCWTCEGTGIVRDEDGVHEWECADCDGTGEERRRACPDER
ncbi:MAG: hypothetical protein AAGF12_37005 [Myxococcota bacterium]